MGFRGKFSIIVGVFGALGVSVAQSMGALAGSGIGFTGLVLVTVSVTGADRLEQHPGAVVRQEGAFMRKLATSSPKCCLDCRQGPSLKSKKSMRILC